MRKAIIGGALVATLLACYFAPDDEADVIAPANARPAAALVAPAAIPEEAPALDIRPRLAEDDLGNAFAKQSWQQEKPRKVMPAQAGAQPAAQAQAAATGTGAGPAPPPIRYLGRYVEDGKVAYFVQLGERNVVAHVGDQFDDSYRFDSADGGTLTFTYLPLHQQQTIAAGDTN